MLSPCLSLGKARRVLFLGIGGGGDVVTAAALALSFERCGGEAFIGSIVWERYVHDPVPGPIDFSELFNVEKLGTGLALVNRDSYAVRGQKIVVPQAVKVARVLGREVLVVDIKRGAMGMAKSLEQAMEMLSLDAIVGVDVGGDVVAKGFEDDLWSPLADAIGLAALARLGDERTLLALASPGSDGELPPHYILRRISEIASRRGLVGGYMLTPEDCEWLEKLLREASSEASAIPLKAARGVWGYAKIRGGTRTVFLSPINAVVFLLKPSISMLDSVARFVYESRSLEEAREMLNSIGIYTELDLEMDIAKEMAIRGPEAIDVVEIRERGRQALRERVRRVNSKLYR